MEPSREELDKVSDEYQRLYTQSDSLPEESIPVLVGKVDIQDDLPSESEIAGAVRRLRAPRAGGPSGLTSTHLKMWLAENREAQKRHHPTPSRWAALVQLVRYVWETGDLPKETAWASLVLLPKAVEGEFRGIGLLEIFWKLNTSIIDVRIKLAVDFHDCLHGFRPRRGTGTACIEAKLLQQLSVVEQSPLFKVFLDLKKAYDTLDRHRALEILEAYGAGPRMLRLLRRFWELQQVVARQNGFYGDPFSPSRGMTQGDVISPTLFNVICDSIIRYWLFTVTSDPENAIDGLGTRITMHNALFYADDGEISSRDPEWLQSAIDVLASLFERVGLKTNTTKTEVMVCGPGYISQPRSDAGYRRRTTEEGDSYQERQRRCVECPDCGLTMQAGTLAAHRRRIHGIEPSQCYTLPPAGSRLYTLDFPKHLQQASCPVPGCSGSAKSHFLMRRHFQFRHPEDTVHIRQESMTPLPKCEQCDLQLPGNQLTAGHRASAGCKMGAQRKQLRQATRVAAEAQGRNFSIYGVQLPTCDTFKYLGRPMSSTDSDWPAVLRNLKKARQKWSMARRILARQGADARISGNLYKAVVQSILLYGSETWVLTAPMVKVLEGFHHKVLRQITGRQPKYDVRTDTWSKRPIFRAYEEAGVLPIVEYIHVRQMRIANYVATRPIYELCRNATWRPGSARRTLWWTQPKLQDHLASL